MLEGLNASQKVVGTRRLLKAVEAGEIRRAYVALDADLFITRKVTDLCRAKNVPLVEVNSMKELGRACGVDVPTAAAGEKFH